jgi:holo-[acyl-carrier protein] synthase
MLAEAEEPAIRVEVGVDIIEIDRVRASLGRWGDRFLKRVFTPAEIRYSRGRPPELAVRFAAKEAASKALGTGMRGLAWREVEVLSDRRGKPLIVLHGRAKERSQELGVVAWSVSLSHSRDSAIAVVAATLNSTPRASN